MTHRISRFQAVLKVFQKHLHHLELLPFFSCIISEKSNFEARMVKMLTSTNARAVKYFRVSVRGARRARGA